MLLLEFFDHLKLMVATILKMVIKFRIGSGKTVTETISMMQALLEYLFTSKQGVSVVAGF